MSQAANLMLIAMVALIIWTLVISWTLAWRRTAATKSGDVKIKFYTTYQGEGESGALAQHTRHHINLLELPILFYVMVILIVTTQVADYAYAYLAWGFTLSRFAHSAIHLTYNNVLHRFFAFVIGLIIVSILAVRYMLALL